MKTLSHTSIQLYLDCPLKWKFKYVDKLPEKPKSFFSFGKSIHSALQFFYSKPTAPTLTEMLDYYNTTWISEGYKSGDQEAKEKLKGQEILTDFHTKHAPKFKTPLYIEYQFFAKIDGIPVMGFIDRIDKLADGSVVITDYKTGSALAKERATIDPQLTMYQIICEDVLNLKVSKVILYHVNSLVPSISNAHTQDQIYNLKNQIKKVAAAIEQKSFEANPEAYKCSRCDYNTVCPAYKQTQIPLTFKKA
jgi:CRISPR/Cas system-associated exonuclease Cas4 (RecB family)